jgi:hypothetical protein
MPYEKTASEISDLAREKLERVKALCLAAASVAAAAIATSAPAATTAVATATAAVATTTTAVATAAATITTATSATGRASFTGARFVDRQWPAFYRLAIELGDCFLGVRFGCHRDKGEAARFTGELVLHQRDLLDRPRLSEKILQICFGRVEGKISYV